VCCTSRPTEWPKTLSLHFVLFFSRLVAHLNLSLTSLGDAATYLKCGEKYCVIIIENFLFFLAVKEF